jgi:hypothetical protein
MVTRISTTRQFKHALMYNERKVKSGAATFLDAGFFIEDPGHLTLEQKFGRLHERMQLNDRAKVKTVHFSLNFDPKDQLSDSDLKRIANVFLSKIGLSNQPYLLYEHHDAAHRHVHILSTLIRSNGTKVKTQGLSLELLRTACREIETDFGLNPCLAGSRRQRTLQAGQASKVLYGTSELKTSMTAVLKNVLDHFYYTSLSELNGILRQYNIQASRGRPGCPLYENGGLIYRALDENGTKIGAPIAASKFHLEATLRFLKERFSLNQSGQAKNSAALRNAVDFALLGKEDLSLQSLAENLSRKGIRLHLWREAPLSPLTLTYVDNRCKCAFDARALGEHYTFESLVKRCNQGHDGRVLDPQVLTRAGVDIFLDHLLTLRAQSPLVSGLQNKKEASRKKVALH